MRLEAQVKVLLLADGSSVHAVRYQAELRRFGVEVVLASIEEGETVDIILNRPTGINAFDYALAARTIRKFTRNNSYDLINPHFACGYGFMAALSGIWKKKPVLLHCLGSDILISPRKSRFHKWRVAYALRKAYQVLVDSQYLGSEAKKIYNKINYKVIAWGADDKFFESFNIKSQNGLIWNKPIKVVVPRAHYRVYNNRFIVHALKDIIKNNKIIITFPGWGDDLGAFKELVRSEHIDSGIEYYGFLSREKFNEFISEFDVYLSASLSDSSPASLIEAMAAGLYPIVGDIPGVREWMDSSNGALFDLRDTESLKKTFESILEKPSDLAEILKRNYIKAEENGKFSKNIEETVALMQKMIKDAGKK